MDYITIEKPDYDDLLKIKLKYEALMKKSILSLSGTSIYYLYCDAFVVIIIDTRIGRRLQRLRFPAKVGMS